MTYVPAPGSIPTLTVPSLDGIDSVHMIGVGGVGMSGIARLLMARGIAVSGSDMKESAALDSLRKDGAAVFAGHSAGNLGSPDAVIISTAIPETNPELAAAKSKGMKVFARTQILSALAEGSQVFAVAGTHGKTTTTSMLSVILEHAGADPSFVIGADLNESGSGAKSGRGGAFVAEADESDGSFLLLSPGVAIVTNVEADHLDFYKGGEAEIREAFGAFIRGAGRSIVCWDDEGARASAHLSGTSVFKYGTGPENNAILTVETAGVDESFGVVSVQGHEPVRISLKTPGVHNLLNATAAIAAATFAGVEPSAAAEGLRTFTGVRRRFESRGTARGAVFVDDYAHHPTEISATLNAARERHEGRLVAVFQPHRYSRTEALWKALGESLAPADVSVVTDVYAAGEAPIPGVSGKLLVEALTEFDSTKKVVYLPRRSEVVSYLSQIVSEGDLVLTLGAGDVTMVAGETIERIRAGS